MGKMHYVNDSNDNRCRTPDVMFPKSFDLSHVSFYLSNLHSDWASRLPTTFDWTNHISVLLRKLATS